MPASFLSSLTDRARTAYPIIQRAVRESFLDPTKGLTAPRLLSLLQEHDLGIRLSTLRDIMRRERAINEHGASLRFMRPSSIPDPSRLPFALTRLRRGLSFVVEVRGTLLGTGADVTQQVTVTLDKPRSRAAIERAAIAAVKAGGERYGMSVESAVLVSGVRAGEQGTL